ncbi:phosphoribosylglycinamide formyltransferase [Glaciecola sp. SC05]|uniref:phosphoribosylglycinamide formyltransferase n=1 Tax=Glaciecola sp. SC05 TaxID=1987355 RepID=UPI0035272F9E
MSKRIVILVSGNGSNAQAIIDACNNGRIKASVVALISNKKDAFGLQRARKHNIDAISISHTDYGDRESFDLSLLEIIQSYRPDLVVLAGFMRILSSHFVDAFAGKLLNIHPSILPKYPGLHTHQRALDNGDKVHGSSVHFVTAELDGGPVVLKGIIDIMPQDDANSLATRLASTEWQIYPSVVEWFCDDRLTLIGDEVLLDNKTLPKGGIVYE